MTPYYFGFSGFALLFIFAIVGVELCMGCGGSRLETTTTAYGAARAAHDRAVATVRTVVSQDLRDHCGNAADPEECTRNRAGRWRGVESSVNAAAGTFDAASLALLRWAEEDPDGKAPPGACEAVRDALSAVRGYLDLLSILDVRVPEIARLEVSCE